MGLYIGARYTPKFMGEHDITTEYEALSVVDNGEGTTYISNKPVPAGTPLTNTNYWTVYGSSSGAILDLQRRVDVLEGETESLTAGRDLIIIAASYGRTPSTTINCIAYLKPMLSEYYDNIYDVSIGGAGFVNGDYKTMLLSIETENPEYVKDILIIGFGNDIYEPFEDVVTAMTDFTNTAKSIYPHATIRLAPVSTQGTLTGAAALYNCFRYIVGATTTHKMSIMTRIFHILALSYYDYLDVDQGHPTGSGALLIANAIFNTLINGDYNFPYVRNEDTISAKTYEGNYITQSSVGFMYDSVFCDTDQVCAEVRINFTAQATVSLPSAWNNLLVMTCNENLRGTNLVQHQELLGFLTDRTSDTVIPIALTHQMYNDDWWYYMSTKLGKPSTITQGHEYSIAVYGVIPFTLN